MKKTGKILSIFMALLMLTSLTSGLSINANAASNVTVKYNVKENYTNATKVFKLVNSERGKKNLGKLKLNKELTTYAMQRAAEIALLYSHTRPNGSSAISKKGVNGENIAVGYTSAAETMQYWMNSKGHRENILRKSFKSMGVGCVQIDGYCYWVQIFSNSSKKSFSKKGTVTKAHTVSITSGKLHTFILIKNPEAESKNDMYDYESDTISTAKYPDGCRLYVCAIHNDTELGDSGYGYPVLLPGTLDFKSSDKSVLTVNAKGIATVKKNGKSTITASLKSSSKIKAKTAFTAIEGGDDFYD